MKSTLCCLFSGFLLVLVVACQEEKPPVPRSMGQVREIVLERFQELDGFKLDKQTEVGLGAHSALRMEGSWTHEGQPRRGIIYVIDHPQVFNIVHYTAPLENDLFKAGQRQFQEILRGLRSFRAQGPVSVSERDGEKVMRNPDLQLEIRYPADWAYTLDEVNRAVVFSGPKNDPAWLTTVSFSVVHKWREKS